MTLHIVVEVRNSYGNLLCSNCNQVYQSEVWDFRPLIHEKNMFTKK